MDLYTMNENFIAQDVIDDFISAIWTERYSSAGEVELVVPATSEMIDRLKEGTYLGLRGTREVMELQTQSIENNELKVIGQSLLNFLDQRFAWFRNLDWTTSDPVNEKVVDRNVTGKVGQIIADAVDDMVINTGSFGGDWASANLEWAMEEIPGLILGDVDVSGVDERVTIPVGPLYSSIRQVAEKYNVGISLYLDSVSLVDGFVLKFTTYRGLDRTSDQEVNSLVRLVPDMESLSNIKELRSIHYYKNVAYVYYQGEITIHYAEEGVIPEGLARRVLVVNAEDEPIGRKSTYTQSAIGVGSWTYTSYYVGPGDIAAFRAQHAKDALANHNYIRAVDGQTSPINEYKFGVNYGLGDVIELQGLTGMISKARVTEYIRAQDKTGEREYPTISVIAPEGGA